MGRCDVTDGTYDLRFITRKWAPAMGGMETYCLRLTEQLAKSCRMEVVALPGRKNGAPPSAISLLKFGITTVVRTLVSRETQVVHIADVACWPFALVARLRHPQSRIVISAHGSDLTFADRGGWRAGLYRHYLALAVRLIGHLPIIANSRFIADAATRQGFANVHLVPLATDIVGQRPTGPSNSAILYAGRIASGKGLRFFIENVLPALGADVRLRVAGKIWDQDEAKALDHPNVDYLGILSPQALATEYQTASCTIMPSQSSEGFGLVAVEAAACGGVVIASDHSGLREAAADGIGILVEASDAAAWANAINDVAGWTSAQRDDFTGRAATLARQKYSWARVAEETIAVYGSAFAAKASAA
jgi:phosphatidyl-myo-inositol dimannoside synthase